MTVKKTNLKLTVINQIAHIILKFLKPMKYSFIKIDIQYKKSFISSLRIYVRMKVVNSHYTKIIQHTMTTLDNTKWYFNMLRMKYSLNPFITKSIPHCINLKRKVKYSVDQ